MKKTIILIGLSLVIGVGLLVFGSRSGDQPQALNPNSVNYTAPSQELQAELDKLENNAVVLGSADAPVTLIEFGDYQCTFCTKFFFETKPTLEDKYVSTGQLKMIFVDYAINGHESVNAAEASQCATDQGQFWDFHNKLYQEREGYNVGVFKRDKLIQYAAEIGLNTEEFIDCYDSGKYEDKVADSTRRSPLFGARGTPTFLLNGQLIPGAQPLSFFENAIEQMLATADFRPSQVDEELITPIQ